MIQTYFLACHSFHSTFTDVCYVPGTAPGTKDSAVNKTNKSVHFQIWEYLKEKLNDDSSRF